MTEEKKKIDAILNDHQIKYSFKIEFEKKHYTNQYITVELKSNSKLLKDSKITFSDLVLL